MSSDEDDYMSEELIKNCADIRPGLANRDAARLFKSEARHKKTNLENSIKSRKVLEAEQREEGLKRTLDVKNKGFAMLQRMGFKPGMALGKKGEGRSEPVPIEVKCGRTGIGHESELMRKREARTRYRQFRMQKKMKLDENQQNDFKSRHRNKLVESKVNRNLYNSQKVCHQLDFQANVLEPCEPFFWPKCYLKKDMCTEDDSEAEEDEETDEDFSASEKVEILTLYLRNQYTYCVWCGTSYRDKEDMLQNCPGDTEDLHE